MNDIIFGDLGLEIIKLLQSHDSSLIDLFFEFISLLGNALVLIVIMISFYWTGSKSLAKRITYLLIFNYYLNVLLKGVFGHPRPYQSNPNDIRQITSSDGYAFPSGHAQLAPTVWGFFAYESWKNKYKIHFIVPISLTLMFLIAISRIFLAVHWPSDVIVGVLLGLATMFIFLKVETPAKEFISAKSDRNLVIASFILSVTMVIVSTLIVIFFGNDPLISNNGQMGGVLFGLTAGIILEEKHVKFDVVPVKRYFYAVRLLIGISFTLGTYFILSFLFEPFDGSFVEIFTSYVRYACVSVVAAFIIPLLFQKIESKLE